MGAEKKELLPLEKLCEALCKKGDANLFRNQIVLYRLLIPFISDDLQQCNNTYAPVTVDDLISDIRRYLVYIYENPGKCMDKSTIDRFSSMHCFIYNNLTLNHESKLPSFGYMDKELLATNKFDNLASNINSTIKNRRPLPKSLTSVLCRYADDKEILLYRCFWMLQYYFVYYKRDVCTVNRTASGMLYMTRECTELYRLSEDRRAAVLDSLKENCGSFLDYISKLDKNSLDILSLSRIIIDVIICQANKWKRAKAIPIIGLERIPEIKDEAITEKEQYIFYRTCIDGFGIDSYDRYVILCKYAEDNCYAANELATAYYWGKSYFVQSNNYFVVKQDYEKAREWFEKAIKKSSPPLKNACWMLGCTLANMSYSSQEERAAARNTAVAYLEMAGEYPAAINRRAKYLFREANELYSLYSDDEEQYGNILNKFEEAIILADKAASMHCFYGNNQIADFLNNHMKDNRLISDLRERLTLNTPLDVEAQLLKACSYNSAWAQKYLAVFYIKNGEKDKAQPLLIKSMKSGYNSAYYEMAKNFCEKESKEWFEYMHHASRYSQANATYELLMVEKDLTEKMRLIALCKQQILSYRILDTELLNEVNRLFNEAA